MALLNKAPSFEREAVAIKRLGKDFNLSQVQIKMYTDEPQRVIKSENLKTTAREYRMISGEYYFNPNSFSHISK